MSPEQKRDFETEWPALANRLERFLARKNIAASLREDLIQETALRLLVCWDGVDRRRSLWPLTATIALNLVRDNARRLSLLEIASQLPDARTPDDVEKAGLARVELDRVRRALETLSEAHRTILLTEVGDAHTNGSSPAAQKMLRMRARRKLQAALEKVSTLVALRFRRLTELVQTAFSARESLMQGGACLLCIAFGFGTIAAVPAPLASGEVANVMTVAAPSFESEIASAAAVDLLGDARLKAQAAADRVAASHASRNKKVGAGRGGDQTQSPSLLTPPEALPVGDHVSVSGGEVPQPPEEAPEVPEVPDGGRAPAPDGEGLPQPPRLPLEPVEEAVEGLIPRAK